MAIKKQNMYLLIITLPLLGTIFAGLFGNQIGVKGAIQISVTCITLTFLPNSGSTKFEKFLINWCQVRDHEALHFSVAGVGP